MRKAVEIKIPNNVLKICAELKKHGFVAYPVGGCVRDVLMSKEPKDWDIATSAPLEASMQLLSKVEGLKEIKPTGESFPVCRARFENFEEYEVATFRKDEGKGKETTSVYGTIEDDVRRRDLTINALFYDVDTKEVVDLVGGIEDLEKGLIRFVGEAKDRIEEDKLRVLRAVRMASRFGFSFDEVSRKAMFGLNIIEGKSGQSVPFERVILEFESAEKQTKICQYFEMLFRMELVEQFFPNLKLNKPKQFDKLTHSVASMLIGNEPEKLTKTLIEKCKWSRPSARAIVFLIEVLKFEGHDVSRFLKAKEISTLLKDEIVDFVSVYVSEKQLKIIEALCDYEETVSGDDLLKMGYSGAELGRVKKEMEDKKFKEFCHERR